MAYFVGNPGEGALKRGALWVAFGVISLTLFAGLVLTLLAWASGSGSCTFTLTSLVIAVELWFFRDTVTESIDGYREGRNWLKGASGEWVVAQELEQLPPDYIVFNDFRPLKDGKLASWNVDHIVIGPTGVFVIETKNYSRTRILPAARDPRTARNARQADNNARDFKSALIGWSGGALKDVFVVPLLVYAQEGASVERLKEGNVRVLPLRLLNRTILSHRENALDFDGIIRLSRVLYYQIPAETRAPFEEDFFAHAKLSRESWRGEKAKAQVRRENGNDWDLLRECPRCGAKLVERVARTGANAGGKFWGCSAFPKCRYIRNLEVG